MYSVHTSGLNISIFHLASALRAVDTIAEAINEHLPNVRLMIYTVPD